ncbi:MAG: radical SAM protein [Deltaproteobacteria bacterium]|nr:radical SAM protein [Deltaproteobacteria bacterium]
MSIFTRFRNYIFWKRHRLKVDSLALKHPLQYLFFEVSRKCNLACVYCGSSCTGKEDGDELSSEEWIEIARQTASDFVPKNVMIAVTGGEPLIKPGIMELFNEIHRLGFRYGMVTNGQTLGGSLAEELVKAGIGSISISMDAPPETNDSLRGRGVSKKVEDAVVNLKEAGYKGKLEIISTVTKPAMRELDEMRKYVASLKVPLWRAAPVIPIGRASEHPELVPDEKDVRLMLEYIRKSRRDNYMPHPEFSEEGFIGFRFEGKVRPYLCQCRAGITVGGIMHNGKIGACPELAEAFIQGDIRKERFKIVWDERYQNMRDRSWTKKGECAECGFYYLCRGGALHLYPDMKSPFIRCFYLMLKESERYFAS